MDNYSNVLDQFSRGFLKGNVDLFNFVHSFLLPASNLNQKWQFGGHNKMHLKNNFIHSSLLFILCIHAKMVGWCKDESNINPTLKKVVGQ